MYLKYHRLTRKPFEISPDPKFLWLGSKYRETLASIEHGISENKALMILTGDSGTGKTNELTKDLYRRKRAKNRFRPSFYQRFAQLAKQEQSIIQTEQALIELTKELKKEKNDKILLQAELSKKAELIIGLQQKQEKLKNNNHTQGSKPINNDAQDNPNSGSDALETEIEPPNPNDFIDWIIYKNPGKN